MPMHVKSIKISEGQGMLVDGDEWVVLTEEGELFNLNVHYCPQLCVKDVIL
jgi:hypothetical protein